MASERISSSVTTPPAFRMIWASPSANPDRVDIQSGVHAGHDGDVSDGGNGRGPVKLAA